jgi:hypothetical protein
MKYSWERCVLPRRLKIPRWKIRHLKSRYLKIRYSKNPRWNSHGLNRHDWKSPDSRPSCLPAGCAKRQKLENYVDPSFHALIRTRNRTTQDQIPVG